MIAEANNRDDFALPLIPSGFSNATFVMRYSQDPARGSTAASAPRDTASM